MPLFIFLIYPFLEILAFSNLIDYWGWGNTILWVIGSGFLGLSIMASQGRNAFTELQTRGGANPTSKVIHSALVFMGGFLLFLPGLVTDALGILLILPGARHLIVAFAKAFVLNKITQGAFRVFKMGQGASGGFTYQSYKSGEAQSFERDATVVDVKPIEITHQNIPNKDDD